MPLSARNNHVLKRYPGWWSGKCAILEWMVGSAYLMSGYLNRSVQKVRGWQRVLSRGRPFQTEGRAIVKALRIERTGFFQVAMANASEECCHSLPSPCPGKTDGTGTNPCTSHWADTASESFWTHYSDKLAIDKSRDGMKVICYHCLRVQASKF